MEPPGAHVPGRRLSRLTAPQTRSGRVPGGPGATGPDQNGLRAKPRLVPLGAATGLAMMAATASGDVFAAAVLLGLAAADIAAGAVGVLVGVAVVGRWGSSSLAALSGGQAVVGAAGWSGPVAMVLSSWATAFAIVLACPRRRPVPTAATEGATGVSLAGVLACGLLAAALVAGPAAGADPAPVVALRVGASLVAVVVAAVVAGACSRPTARVGALIAAAAAAALAVLA